MEYITTNGVEYAAKHVTTTTNQIIITLADQMISDIEPAFRAVTSLSVSGEDKQTYGEYDHLAFESAEVLASGEIVVTMRIKSETELRLDETSETLRVQDGAISDLGEAVSNLSEGGLL